MYRQYIEGKALLRNRLDFNSTFFYKNRQITQEHDLLVSLFDHLTSDLSNSHHKVRSISISLLSLLPFVFYRYGINQTAMMTQMEIQKIISNYARDSDPRVRKVKQAHFSKTEKETKKNVIECLGFVSADAFKRVSFRFSDL